MKRKCPSSVVVVMTAWKITRAWPSGEWWLTLRKSAKRRWCEKYNKLPHHRPYKKPRLLPRRTFYKRTNLFISKRIRKGKVRRGGHCIRHCQKGISQRGFSIPHRPLNQQILTPCPYNLHSFHFSRWRYSKPRTISQPKVRYMLLVFFFSFNLSKNVVSTT